MLILAIAALSGCAHGLTGIGGVAGTSPAPQTPWSPPPESAMPRIAKPAGPNIPSALLAPGARWSLADLVDVALRNSSQTRAAWDQARAAAAAYASQKANWLPQANVTYDYSVSKPAPFGGRTFGLQRTYGPTLDATWLLFNFGGRAASISEFRYALMAADFTHNATIQNVVLAVEQAYFQYTTASALAAAQQSSVGEAQANLNAARARHEAGVATIADVLQAQTALSQAQLNLETSLGQIETTRGTLATAMGLPANLPFDVQVGEGPPPDQTLDTIDRYLEAAQSQRPDLAAARAQALQAASHVGTVRANALPSLTGTGSLGRSYLVGHPTRAANSYSGTVAVRMPVFPYFNQVYDVREARANAEAAGERYETLRQTVVLQVWTDYASVQTAKQRLATSADLLQSATQNQTVALGRYQSGVGTILDLISAQAALETARATSVQARADWYLAIAQLAHDTGTLGPGAGIGAGGGTGVIVQPSGPGGAP